MAIFDQDRFYLQIFRGKQRRELCVPLSRALKITEETSHGQPVSSRVSSSTESSDSIEFAKHWIGECNSNHGLHCSALVLPGEQYLPKRLLYVGESSSGLPVLRLQGTASLALDPADVTYLALSYSRGDSYVKLTSKNKRAWETHIDQDSLPLSFQHAITLTRQLNFRYLWIDILCSIQDSPDDYLAESKEIGRVYASASCTISACASIDASGGCFQDRPCCPQEFPCYLRFSRGKALAIRADVPVDSEAFHAQVEESPLGQRGYALQERLLSRRVLHFGSRFGAFTNLDLDEELCMHRCWFRLVSKVTVGKREAADRLDAVDGLALAIGGEKNNLSYTHGLWQRHLLFDLLWFIRSGQTEKPRQLRPPSWSWAAVDGAVDQQLMIDEKGFEGKKHVILKIATDMSASEPAQETDQGLLVLHCPVLRAVNLASSESHCQTVEVQSPHGGVQARFVPDTLDFDHVNDLVVAEIVREMVYDPSRQNRTSEIWSNGLVLRRIQHGSGRRGLVFQRIGRFWMEWPWYSPGFRPGAYIEKRVFGNGMVIRIA
ncbi:hypothetical protein PENNAL_c0001G04608 [Penicillium nalgiovense]|uniref:Heterokaryon incompatibility domain-containing protein n=1 Tax=Penicillium nalgiovense TaxID=60175 RepID=A0A1V6ZA67_PENNA|nr:hypothetical protein PENNAL_c0001G04608 [Penicillium nalgiovense]